MGKSHRSTIGLLEQLVCRGNSELCGVAHCMPTNAAICTMFEYYQIQEEYVSELACKLHGRFFETRMHPRHSRFVTLCTPVSLFHLFKRCDRWGDIRYIILDEVRENKGLFMLVVALLQRCDVRVVRAKLLLLTAFKVRTSPYRH